MTVDEEVDARRGDWIQTYTGRMFWPLDPRPGDFCIQDIAHALANICRFNGHCTAFYSVAEHSIHVSRIVPPKDALAGLLHDAAEAYITDLPRPVKRFMADYKEVERQVERALATAFGLDFPWSAAIKQADDGMLAAEAEQLMAPPPTAWILPQPPAAVRIVGFAPSAAEERFLARFTEISALRSEG